MNQRKRKSETVLRQLAELENLSTKDLRAKWEVLYGQSPPRFNRQFLIKRLAYRIQEIAYGGMDDFTRERMENLLNDEGYDDLGRKTKNPTRRANLNAIVPGTILTREWQGERHEVISRDGGTFEYRGMPYRSLSAVARAITGTRWNGPAFFGLRGKNINVNVKEAVNARA
jgi:hypothetical protein